MLFIDTEDVNDVEMGEEEEQREAKPVKTSSSKKKLQKEEIEDRREHINIIFIGHVGKSVLQPYLTLQC